MDNSDSQILDMITDEPYYTEANHRTVEFNFLDVVLQILHRSEIQFLLRVIQALVPILCVHLRIALEVQKLSVTVID